MLTMTNSGKRRGFWAAARVWLFAAALSAVTPGIAVAGDNPTPPGAPTAVQPAPEMPAPPAPPTPPAPPAPAAAAAPAPASIPPQPAAVNRPGFLHELGRWWEGSIAYFNTKMKDAGSKFEDFNKTSNEAAKGAAAATQEAMKSAVDASKDAASAIVRLPNTRVVEVRERCGTAPNGAPDCPAAAASACRAKGFNSGRPLDVRSSEACPPAIVLSGRTPVEGECPVETVVLRAVCQ